MARPYSMDLRERVVAAVVDEGMSCHAAAARFGGGGEFGDQVGEAGSRHGKCCAEPDGWTPGAHRDWLLERTATDFTLRGLVAELAERGVLVDYVQVWRFVHAEGLSFKNVWPTPSARGLSKTA